MIDPAQMAQAMPGMAPVAPMPAMPVPQAMAPMAPMAPVDPTIAPAMGGIGMPVPPPPGPEAEPLLLIPDWLIEEIAEAMLERENDMVERTYEVLGPPREVTGYTIDQQVAMYLAVPADLQNDDEREAVIAQMRADGVAEDEIMDTIYPLRSVLFAMQAAEGPDAVEAYARHIHPIAQRRLNNLPDPEDPFGPDDDETSDDGPSYDSEDEDLDLE